MNIAIKKYRQKMDLTMKGFGDKIGLSEASVSRLEAGKQGMTIDLAKRIETVTGIPARVWAFPEQSTDHPLLQGEGL